MESWWYCYGGRPGCFIAQRYSATIYQLYISSLPPVFTVNLSIILSSVITSKKSQPYKYNLNTFQSILLGISAAKIQTRVYQFEDMKIFTDYIFPTYLIYNIIYLIQLQREGQYVNLVCKPLGLKPLCYLGGGCKNKKVKTETWC